MIDLRPATEADKPYLAWLEEACMRDYAVALWGTWPSEPSDRTTLDSCRIVLDRNRVAGCVSVIAHADHWWLDELFIAPAFQRRGIGGEVLRRVIAEARSSGLPLRLSVITTNPALAFYRRHGFCVDAETWERRYMSI